MFDDVNSVELGHYFYTGSRGDRGLRHGNRQTQRAIRHSQHNIQVGL
jgi:hypothetical protein